jgi:hypothetical protein
MWLLVIGVIIGPITKFISLQLFPQTENEKQCVADTSGIFEPIFDIFSEEDPSLKIKC